MPDHPPLVISIQSQMVFGYVGNSAALFPMQAARLEVAPIPTVILSNQPGYPKLRGAPLPPDLFADLLPGARERGLAQRAAYQLVTGYITSVEVAHLMADFMTRCWAANSDLRYLCDPVMGVRPLSLADMATANSFKLAYQAGRPVATPGNLDWAAVGLGCAGPC